MVRVPESTIGNYRRFSLYNSPYPAHDEGGAIDLYPETEQALSPVSGTVRDVRRVRAPPKQYADTHDMLLVIELDHPRECLDLAKGSIARILHVDPAVEPGEPIAIGDPLGRLVRSGFFAPWVDDHLHLEFRGPGVNPYRARGSLPIEVGVGVDPVRWDGSGTVIERTPSAVVLDSPSHPAPGERFAALAADDGPALDGGVVHYPGGGVFTSDSDSIPKADPMSNPAIDDIVVDLSLLGCPVGTARGRTVEWADVAVFANDEQITGLSLFAAREHAGVKLVWPEHDLAVGEQVTVDITEQMDRYNGTDGSM